MGTMATKVRRAIMEKKETKVKLVNVVLKVFKAIKVMSAITVCKVHVEKKETKVLVVLLVHLVKMVPKALVVTMVLMALVCTSKISKRVLHTNVVTMYSQNQVKKAAHMTQCILLKKLVSLQRNYLPKI